MLGAITLAAYRFGWPWTGMVAQARDGATTKNKTLWDWMQLLIVPAVLAAAAYGINSAQSERDHKREEQRRLQQAKLADDGRQNDAVRAYLQGMSGLIADSKVARTHDSSLKGLARSLTSTVLRQLDGQRKGQVAQFLFSADLISNNGPVVDMDRADLREMKLADAYLLDASFPGADLRRADLRRAVVDKADFRFTNFRGVDLRGASVSGADFRHADLRGADFRSAFIKGGDFTSSNLAGADFEGATIDRSNFSNSNLRQADFSRAKGASGFIRACLTGARFARAKLTGSAFEHAEGRNVDFAGTDVKHATFAGAALSNVDTRGAAFGEDTTKTFPAGWGAHGLPNKPDSGACAKQYPELPLLR